MHIWIILNSASVYTNLNLMFFGFSIIILIKCINFILLKLLPSLIVEKYIKKIIVSFFYVCK